VRAFNGSNLRVACFDKEFNVGFVSDSLHEVFHILHGYNPVCGIPVHALVDGLDLVTRSLKYRGGITQLVERGTEKPGAILTRVRFPVAARDFLSNFSAVCVAISYSPRVQSHVSRYVCKILNSKHWHPHHCLDTRKVLDIVVGMGSAVLAAALASHR